MIDYLLHILGKIKLFYFLSTNQLDLPDYPSKEILNERLNLAIREGKVGFGFV